MRQIARQVAFHGTKYYSSSVKKVQGLFSNYIQGEIDKMKADGTFKEERIIETPQAGRVIARWREDRKPVLNLCANNYLGWCNNPGILR